MEGRALQSLCLLLQSDAADDLARRKQFLDGICHPRLRQQEPIEECLLMDVHPVDAGDRVINEQPGFDLVDADALRDRAVGVPQ